jgi:hypothetical protein
MSAATPLPETTYPTPPELIGEPAAVAQAPEVDAEHELWLAQQQPGDGRLDLISANRAECAQCANYTAENEGGDQPCCDCRRESADKPSTHFRARAAVAEPPTKRERWAEAEPTDEECRAPRRRHRWERLGTEKGTIECLRCRRCGRSARRVETRTRGSLRLEVLRDDGVWTSEISECPGEQVDQAAELEQDNELLRARCAEEQVRADWLDRKLKESQAELATLKEERRQIQWGSSYLADQAEAELATLRRELAAAKAALPTRQRRVPPLERQGTIKRFDVAGTHGYLTVGHYPDGAPCELFLAVAKEGSTIRGLLDGWARMFSIALQHGVPLDHLIEKVKGSRFEPSGWTDDPEITPVASILDYVARWLERRYLPAPAGEQAQGEQS